MTSEQILSKELSLTDDSTYGSDSDHSIRELEEVREMEETTIHDPIHNSITIPPLCLAVIDTPEFQRLREIKQCGPCDLVYPSASHNRFSHSIGVCHLAGEMVDRLNERSDCEMVTKEEKLCVQLAGLCHDLGHGPYSHLWERFVRKANPDAEWKHEMQSVSILKYLIVKNKLEGTFEEAKVDRELVYSLILGDDNGWPKEKHFLFEIVANKETGIDVDKWDYLLRDAYHFGMGYNMNYKRFLSCTKVVEDEDGQTNIAYRDKLSSSILEMFEIRAKMHRNCYQHRVAKIFEFMLIDALIEADEYFKVIANGKQYKLSACQEDVEAFLKLNDSVFLTVKTSESTDLAKSQHILNRIYRRQMYSIVASFPLKEENDVFLEDLIRRMESEFSKTFDWSIMKLDFGGFKDPLVNVRFFDREGKRVRITMENVKDKHFDSFIRFDYRELLLFCKNEEIPNHELYDMKKFAEEQFNLLSTHCKVQ